MAIEVVINQHAPEPDDVITLELTTDPHWKTGDKFMHEETEYEVRSVEDSVVSGLTNQLYRKYLVMPMPD